MRLCVPLPCFFKLGEDGGMIRAIEKVGELGFDAVETYAWRGFDLKEVKRALDACGVELLSILNGERRLTRPEFRGLWLDELKASCEAANQIGASLIITQVGEDTGEERARQHEAIVETLTLAKPILEAHRVTVMPEPLNIKVNHPGYYLTRSAEAFDIVREVDSPYVKIVYDIYHQQITEGDIIRSVVNNLDCIAHLHSAGNPGRHELQYGENDYKVIFEAIDKAGYTGACGLEYGPLMDPIESLIEAKRLFG